MRYLLLLVMLFSGNLFAQTFDLQSMDRAYCEVIFIDQVKFAVFQIKEGASKDTAVTAFKSKYYTQYLEKFYPDFALQVYDIATTVGNNDVTTFINNGFCKGLVSRINHN
jgi:hypothetical protein